MSYEQLMMKLMGPGGEQIMSKMSPQQLQGLAAQNQEFTSAVQEQGAMAQNVLQTDAQMKQQQDDVARRGAGAGAKVIKPQASSMLNPAPGTGVPALGGVSPQTRQSIPPLGGVEMQMAQPPAPAPPAAAPAVGPSASSMINEAQIAEAPSSGGSKGGQTADLVGAGAGVAGAALAPATGGLSLIAAPVISGLAGLIGGVMDAEAEKERDREARGFKREMTGRQYQMRAEETRLQGSQKALSEIMAGLKTALG